MNFHDNPKNKNGKIDFSFDSAHSASVTKMGEKLWGGGMCISLLRTGPIIWNIRKMMSWKSEQYIFCSDFNAFFLHMFPLLDFLLLLDRKTATDRLIAVRETGASRHHGGPIEGPPETPRTSQYYHIEGTKGVSLGPSKREGRGRKDDVSAEIEEANALRAQLGLAPLR